MELVPIRNHPDEAGLLGAVHLAPVWMFKAFDAVLAVDIGGNKHPCRGRPAQLKKIKRAGECEGVEIFALATRR